MSYSTRRVIELFVLGITLHVVFSSSVFDCYFRNPVVHGVTHYGSNPGETKRLVLIMIVIQYALSCVALTRFE